MVKENDNKDTIFLENSLKEKSALIQTLEEDIPTETEVPSFIYFIFNQRVRAIKIGRSTNVAQSLRLLQTGSFDILKLIYYTEETESITEDSLHLQFHHLRFKENPDWFLATIELIDYIEELRRY